MYRLSGRPVSGHNDAAFQLGQLLEGGKTGEALKWYERAALSGHINACAVPKLVHLL